MAILLGFGVLGSLLLLVALRASSLRRRRAVARRLSMLQEVDGSWEVSGAWLGASEALLKAFRMLQAGKGPGPVGIAVVATSCLVGVLYASWISPRSGELWGLVGGTALAALGWMVGEGALEGIARRRRQRLARALPDWVDTVACYLQVGMSFESAVGLAMRVQMPGAKELKDEWFRYLQDTRLGTSRNDALVALARRGDCEELHRVIGAVMAAPDEREGLAESMHACALDLQAAALKTKHSRERWRVVAIAATALGMAIAIGVF